MEIMENFGSKTWSPRYRESSRRICYILPINNIWQCIHYTKDENLFHLIFVYHLKVNEIWMYMGKRMCTDERNEKGQGISSGIAWKKNTSKKMHKFIDSMQENVMAHHLNAEQSTKRRLRTVCFDQCMCVCVCGVYYFNHSALEFSIGYTVAVNSCSCTFYSAL